MLQRLATRHYYSYTTALGITVGIGCLLLILNMLIFAGIYYQRERDRRRRDQDRAYRAGSTPSSETIPMSQRPSTPGSSTTHSPVSCKKVENEIPPSYMVVLNSLSVPQNMAPHHNSFKTEKKEKPPAPVRTSSNPPGNTVKKRVQIQEISV